MILFLTRLLVAGFTIVLVGCANPPARKETALTAYVAPSITPIASPIQAVRDSLAKAKSSAGKQDWPSVSLSIDTADQTAAKAQIALLAYHAQVEELTVQLTKAIDNRNMALRERDNAQEVVKKQTVEIHQLAKERDIIPYIVAMCLGLWFITLADAIPVTQQYRFWAKLIAFTVGFGSGYGVGRILVRSIAAFLP